MSEELDFSETVFGPAQDIVGVAVLGERQLQLAFEDGVSYPVDLTSIMRGPVFEEIFEQGLFDQARVDADSGTIEWPNGVALDPFMLRELCEAQAH